MSLLLLFPNRAVNNLRVGSQTVDRLYLGSTRVEKLYRGDELIFTDEEAS